MDYYAGTQGYVEVNEEQLKNEFLEQASVDELCEIIESEGEYLTVNYEIEVDGANWEQHEHEVEVYIETQEAVEALVTTIMGLQMDYKKASNLAYERYKRIEELENPCKQETISKVTMALTGAYHENDPNRISS